MVFSYHVALYSEWRSKYRVKRPLMIRDVVNEEVKNYYGKLEKISLALVVSFTLPSAD